MDFRTKKPVEINCLPAQLCIEANRPLEKPNASLIAAGDTRKKGCVFSDMVPSKVDGCKYFFALRDDLLNAITTGRYILVLQDDCTYCDCLEIQFTNRCFITSVERDGVFADTGSCPC